MKFLLFLIACCLCANITLSGYKFRLTPRNYTIFVEDTETQSYIDVFTNVEHFQSQFEEQTKVKVTLFTMDVYVHPEMLVLSLLKENWFAKKFLVSDFGIFSITHEKDVQLNYVQETNAKMSDGVIYINQI